MKILSIDVGSGTQDIMLYDSDESIENSSKMVLPSPTRIFAERIRKHKNDLFLSGETMGGGSVNAAIKNHLKKGYKVIMTEDAARTINDNLNLVESLGVQITPNDEKNPDISEMKLKDVDLNAIKEAFNQFDVELEFDYIGVAVQDHGFMPGMGNRNFRFMKIKEKLDIPRKPEEFVYFSSVPNYFTRMKAVLKTLKGYNTVLMDSKFAAICGITCDDYVKNLDSYIALDIGNGHTLAASVFEGKISGVFEHHTGMLTPNKLINYMEKLALGILTHEQIHGDGGHGAWIAEAIDGFECVVATGPKRKILQKTDFKVHYATPAGDVMMAGPAGIINAINYKKNHEGEY
ncbi:MAG: DUF1786 domain-containing protein [Methanobacterium sp.]|jgi:uncharacterized protein (DUF1786 family)